MKKRVKKLSLHRETLRHLQNVPLGMVVGGTNTSQECFQATGCECNTQDAGCTVPPTGCFATCSCSVLPCR